MTPESREFVAAARKFFAQFKGLFAEIEELEKLDQMVREGEAHLRTLREHLKDAHADIDNAYRKANEEIKEQRIAAGTEITTARVQASEIIENAHDQAGRIVSAARDEAAGFAQTVEAHKLAIAALHEENKRVQDEQARHELARDAAEASAATMRQQRENEMAALRAFRASLPQ